MGNLGYSVSGAPLTQQELTPGDQRFLRLDASNIASADGFFYKKRNRVLNPAMMVSQELGTALTAIGTSVEKYVLDGWSVYNGTPATVSAGQVALATPSGSPYRARVSVTASSASAANDNLILWTKIEGINVADLLYGTASPKAISVRVTIRSPVAGTLPVFLQNSGSSRSWLGSVTIAAGEVGLDVTKTISAISGDTTGTWLTNTGMGLILGIGLSCGSTSQGVAGWQAGNKIGLAGQIQLSTAVQSFDLMDVQLVDGAIIPPFEVPDYGDELRRCQRYYYKGTSMKFLNPTASAGNISITNRWPVTLRATPSVSMSGGGTNQWADVDEATWYASIAGASWYDGGVVVANARL